MASASVSKAIKEAKRIRRNLLRMPCWRMVDELSGACGLASILLSIAVNNVKILRGGPGHIWTEVGGTIIDITASQFNSLKNTISVDGMVNGVLVTNTPKTYHRLENKGFDTYLHIVNSDWYDKRDHPRWDWISEYWL